METEEENKLIKFTLSSDNLSQIFDGCATGYLGDKIAEYVRSIAAGYFGNKMTSSNVANQWENQIFFSKNRVPEYISVTIRRHPEPIDITCYMIPDEIIQKIKDDLKIK